MNFFIILQVYVPTRSLLAVRSKSFEYESINFNCKYFLYFVVSIATQFPDILSFPSILSSKLPSLISFSLIYKIVFIGVFNLRKLFCFNTSVALIESILVILPFSFLISFGSLGASILDLSILVLIKGRSISYFMTMRFSTYFLEI